MNGRNRILWAVLPLMLLFAGCSAVPQVQETAITEVSIREAVTKADPQAAVDAVYAALPDALPQPLSPTSFQASFPGQEDNVVEYFGSLCDPTGGLAELVILRPAEGKRDDVREGLRKYAETRMDEFENYNILRAYEIALGAEIIDQGDYVILLMLPDNEAARTILDEHIPL